MCKSLLSITAWYLLLHERINVLHSSTDIFSYSSFKSVHNSSTFLGFFSQGLSYSNFSIGFMSGLWAGHSITVTSSSENVLTDFGVWHGALFCINTVGLLIAVLILGTTCFFNISLHTVALILPCSLTIGPVPASEIMPNTITLLPPNLMQHLVHWGEYRFSGLRRTNHLPSLSNRLNFDSLLKGTQSHCSSVLMTCSVANFNQLILFFFRNVRLHRSYSMVQLYFIRSSGNSVPWYFRVKVLLLFLAKRNICYC